MAPEEESDRSDFRTGAPTRDGGPEDPLGDADLTDIYLAALAHPLLRREDLLAGGFNEADINDTLPLLEARGMIQRLDRSSWRVLPPDVVLPAFAARLEDRARSVRSSAAAMTRVFQQHQERPQDRDPFEGVQIVTSFAGINQALTRLIGTARRDVMMVYADSPIARMLLDQPMAAHQRDLVNSSGAPVHVQANYSDTLLDHPNFPEMLRLRAAKGDEQRVTPGMRLTTLVNDVGFAMVDLEDDQGQPHGLVVTDSAFSTAIAEVCRWGWQIGVPWRMGADGTNTMGAADQERAILQMMAAGASDAAIARHLKLSQRTVERRVRALMDRLNATTRFQAGVLAVRRDLL
ncbi:LuxR C-terminal-related transcriptional regulator [Allobranchiibius huperziae]|uniref:DNA-binding CsgD family transcriptional regulator n=1 Tax=Allobranchiibius huperziae TaxID=1874116 RepID=A0A853DLV2_9MICO|nr:DNA-binding CsgD family transcriptional regulator [Allobranchiibius huperziae]